MLINLETHHHDRWHRAGQIEFSNLDAGTQGGTVLSYELDYWLEFGVPGEPIDERAVSVGLPVGLDTTRRDTWPGFLADLLPQGHARVQIAKALKPDLPVSSPALDLPLLLRGGGSPIGNVRIREAWAGEQERLAGASIAGIPDADLQGDSERFLEQIAALLPLVSGSSNVQGEWPKLLLTKAADGLWYPDALVEDGEARRHVLVKLKRGRTEGPFDLILRSEPAYWEAAKGFGLRVGERPLYRPNALIIPRFDRACREGKVARFGQESLYSACGIIELGALATHESYIGLLARVASDPPVEIIEYVLRDLLNLAMGNPDNHGRNTALQKRDGWIGLTPLFDFAPMRLHPDIIAPSTRWACLPAGGAYQPLEIAAAVVAASGGKVRKDAVLEILVAKAPFIRSIKTAPGVADLDGEVLVRALTRGPELADALFSAAAL